jgi:chromate transporter
VPFGLPFPALSLPASAPAAYSLGELFLAFLKIGAILYGSGYVLLAFMQAEFVDSRGWLTQQQLVDAIAVGQFTPGPLFSSATFAGYVIDGVPGALAATAGLFLPSFVFVAVTHPLVPRLRRSPWAAPFLDGVNVAALVLMMVVTFQLAGEVLDGWYTVSLFFIGAAVLLRFNPNSAWLVLAGIGAGLLHAAVTA